MPLKPLRRSILKSLLALPCLLVLPAKYAFSRWPSNAFETRSIQQAMNDLYGTSDAAESDQITLDLPVIAQHGAVVPVSVKTNIPNVTSISLFVEGNPFALAANFVFEKYSVADVSTRIKMAGTANVLAVVQADGRLLKTRKKVEVTIGGCGGQIPIS